MFPVFFVNQVPSRPLLEVAQALADRGHDVSVLAATSHLSCRLHSVEAVGLCEYDSRTYASRIRTWLWFTVQAAWRLLAAPSSAVVVVCTNPPLMPYAAALVGMIRGFSCVVRVLDVYPDVLRVAAYEPQSSLFRLLAWCNRWTFARCAAIVTLGETMGDTLAAYVCRRRVRIIPEWITQSEAKERTVRRQGEGRFTVIASGNVGVTHDLAPLAAACRLMDHDDVAFIVSTDHGPAVWNMFAGCRNVQVVPRFDDAQYERAILNADAGFVSLRPGAAAASCPSRVLAYLAHGLPVIAVTDRPSDLATILDTGPCGVVVKPDSGGEGLVHAIRHLMAEPETRSGLSRAALSVAVSDFNSAVCRDAFVEIIESTGGSADGSKSSAARLPRPDACLHYGSK